MNIGEVVTAVVVLGIIAILVGILLGVAAKVFHVEVDERVTKVRELLPGANCGACGFPGCDGLAEAIVAGSAKPNGCPVGKEPVATAIKDYLASLDTK